MSEGRDHTFSSVARQLACAAVLFLAIPVHAAPPRVLLLIVVDQFLPDYLDASYAYTDGLKKLRDESAWYTQARHHHVPTKTEPGHATIVTGLPPSENGVVSENWTRLLAPTLADRLQDKNPVSIVIAVAGKPAPALIMGGKNPDLAGWYSFFKGRFSASSTKPLPDWMAGRKSRRFWPSSTSDRVVAETARRAMKEMGVGADDVPDLVAIGFSSTDQIGHRIGPYNFLMKKNLMQLDKTIGDLLRFCENEFGRDGFTVILTSDHGVISMPESAAGRRAGVRRIGKWKLKRDIESALQRAFPGHKNILLKMDVPHLYLDMNKVDSLERAAEAVETVPDIAAAYVPPFKKKDPFIEQHQNGYYKGRSGQILVRLPENTRARYLWEGTGHGSPYDYDARVPILLWGAGFKPGRYDKPAFTTQIAPTAARLLGLGFSEGKALMEAVSK